MLTYSDHKVKTSVRKLVEFLLRSGDIITGAAVRKDMTAMLEGSRLHRKIQKAQDAAYRSELPMSMTWHRLSPGLGEEYDLVIEGRADGVVFHKEPPSLMIDEIKCLYRDVLLIEEADPLHLAQAKCYAYMYGRDKGLEEVTVRITYCNIETEEIRQLYEQISMDQLEEWFMGLVDACVLWADYLVDARGRMRDSVEKMTFPFTYRPGQKKMTALVYHSIEEPRHLFLQAPTGTGKTISALYPSLKQLGEGKAETIFYLTAKTITRTVAEDTLAMLSRKGLQMHSVTISARDRICIMKEEAEEEAVPACHPDSCERARGHYDRINQAVHTLLTEERQITRDKILVYAERFKVCPYELAFEAAAFCECVICDYNYIFDPHVNGRGLYGDSSRKKSILLIDEAHNFLDRARTMYSADLRREDLTALRKEFQERHPRIVKRTRGLLRMLTAVEKEEKEADQLLFPLLALLQTLEEYLKDHESFEGREETVQIYFRLRHFQMILEKKSEGYLVYSDGSRRTFVLHLFCVDPSSCIEEYLDYSRTAIFFSATLLPVHYFRQLLIGPESADAFSIPSPFDSRRRLLAVAGDVTSRYSRRGEDQYRRMVLYLEQTIRAHEGNYMIFFPSYEMMEACLALAHESGVQEVCDLLVQKSSMDEEERERFLAEFSIDRDRSLAGFCVLGSLFSEGIDLVGDRLVGVLIVGTGLPMVCKEREMIRSYFDTHGKKGYDYAYRYPGMNKVLQAAGRVIRTKEDKGLILLMDDRFLWHENQILLPPDWKSFYQVSLKNWEPVLHSFWER